MGTIQLKYPQGSYDMTDNELYCKVDYMYVGTCIHVSLRINHKGFYGAYRLLLFVRTRTQVLRTDPQVQASVYLGYKPLAETESNKEFEKKYLGRKVKKKFEGQFYGRSYGCRCSIRRRIS